MRHAYTTKRVYCQFNILQYNFIQGMIRFKDEVHQLNDVIEGHFKY
ncbi:hypothetical protein SASK131_23060 [Staphylococcus argenteus]|nr:hypothetical protein TMSFP064_16700 [Staphylococcus argenteus]BCN91298.1 hypothetical protein TMSFP069_16730 [Staphylococcus argenteus]GJF40227.1 hypothetical protein SA19056_24340 [Staphylococcus argenteus]GJF40364.1 hypothetical protein SA19059_00160 [Staphylococcus argenteus]GJF47916.1 hypothetical protein SA19080_24320 [Staphylococcus argenteus]